MMWNWDLRNSTLYTHTLVYIWGPTISSQENVIYCITYAVYCHFTSSIWSAGDSDALCLSVLSQRIRTATARLGAERHFSQVKTKKALAVGTQQNKRSLPGTHRCGQGVMCHRRRSGANRTAAQHPIDLLLGCELCLFRSKTSPIISLPLFSVRSYSGDNASTQTSNRSHMTPVGTCTCGI